jgi:hypothetical protein
VEAEVAVAVAEEEEGLATIFMSAQLLQFM